MLTWALAPAILVVVSNHFVGLHVPRNVECGSGALSNLLVGLHVPLNVECCRGAVIPALIHRIPSELRS